jgi:hypothetical protein
MSNGGWACTAWGCDASKPTFKCLSHRP